MINKVSYLFLAKLYLILSFLCNQLKCIFTPLLNSDIFRCESEKKNCVNKCEYIVKLVYQYKYIVVLVGISYVRIYLSRHIYTCKYYLFFCSCRQFISEIVIRYSYFLDEALESIFTSISFIIFLLSFITDSRSSFYDR